MNDIRSNRFRELLSRVAQGEELASRAIIDEYGSTILRAVRRRMNRQLRDSFDSEDFAQAVWASFFGHLSIVSRIESEGQLAGFLGRMASNKVIDAGRREQRRPPTQNTENGLPVVSKDMRRAVSEPTPSQHAVANERWEKLQAAGDGRYVKLLTLVRAGFSSQEIADRLGMSDRHVRRILRRLNRSDHAESE